LSNRSSILRIFPATEKIFFRDGLPLKEGQILIQKDLANTLRRIATSGGNEFYVGYTAELIAAEMKAGGGLMTADDLKAYRLKERRPVTQRYGDYQVFSMPPPSSGGVRLIQMLNMLEHEPKQPSYHLWAETMRRAFADRARYMGDPEFTKVPTAALISKSYGASLRSTIDDGRATDSKTLQNATIGSESPSTTHISVVDRWGNAVSTTQTINYSFGSCVVAAGTGVLLNDEMDDFVAVPGEANVFGLVGSAANEIAPGKTPLSSMTPTIVLDNNGVKLVVGSPGGPRIINAVAQVVAKVLFEKKPLLDAVHRYRIHHQWMPDQIFVEPDGLTATERSSLVDKGHQLKEITNIGDIQAIAKEDGTWVGVSDARSEGRPKGVYSLPNFER
jgi:gamma-glutamyltranspeptidase/glutathione hydrolase